MPTEDRDGELFFYLNKNHCHLMSTNKNLNSQEGRRDIKVAHPNSELELLKAQLSTNNQVRKLMTCHLLTDLISIENSFLYHVFIHIAQLAQLRNPMTSLCKLSPDRFLLVSYDYYYSTTILFQKYNLYYK